MSILRPTRRHTLAILGSALAMPAIIGRAAAVEQFVSPIDFGLGSDGADDQSAAMQAAIDAAASRGIDLLLPGGTYSVHDLDFHGNMRVVGSSGGTHLSSWGDAPVGHVGSTSNLVFDGVTFAGGGGVPPGENRGLIELEGSTDIIFRTCMFIGSPASGIVALNSSAMIETCVFAGLGDAAIHSFDGKGLFVRGNRISECRNAGIRIWRSASGHDGSIITGNSISQIDWTGGGNGQNGNGVNVYQADDVIVSDNVISDCAFTAVRVNAGHNTQVRGNTCLRSGEVAIFSEFGFSGSVIADNIVDGAATGIDITNLDSGGHLATCTGNIVRNIAASSAVNPDTRPVGIYAEADTVVANNVIENVPGIGIAAGYGPFVRNVSVTANVLTGCTIGIGLTVVDDPQVGRVLVSGNMISDTTQGAVVGLEWEKVVSDDLVRDVERYPKVTVAGNVVG